MRVPYRFVASRLAVVSVIGATSLGLTTAAMAQEATRLSWELRDVKDAMADTVSPTAASEAQLSSGITVQVAAKCNEAGAEFKFDLFQGNDAVLLAWRDDVLQLRVRINGGNIRIARAKEEYTNEAKIVFYDPATAERLVNGALNQRGNNSPLKPLADSFIASYALATIKENAAGTFAELTRAATVRVELALADGRTNVVDLNPKHDTLNSLLKQCLGNMRQGADERRRTAEQKAEADGARLRASWPLMIARAVQRDQHLAFKVARKTEAAWVDNSGKIAGRVTLNACEEVSFTTRDSWYTWRKTDYPNVPPRHILVGALLRGGYALLKEEDVIPVDNTSRARITCDPNGTLRIADQ